MDRGCTWVAVDDRYSSRMQGSASWVHLPPIRWVGWERRQVCIPEVGMRPLGTLWKPRGRRPGGAWRRSWEVGPGLGTSGVASFAAGN